MTRFCIVVASIFLLALLSIATGQQISDSQAVAEAAIRAADAAGLKAAQAKDVAGATANYSDDASWLPPHAPIVQGKKAIRNAWAQLLSNPGLKISWQITEVHVSHGGDMAYTLYKYEMTFGVLNGAEVNDRGKDMAVWQKQSDGTWKIVADSFNSDSPPSGASK